MPSASELVQHLEKAFPGADVHVRDLTGSGDHFEARVVSEVFFGKSMREQHQLVHRELEGWLSQVAVHGLALVTEAPDARLEKASTPSG